MRSASLIRTTSGIATRAIVATCTIWCETSSRLSFRTWAAKPRLARSNASCSEARASASLAAALSAASCWPMGVAAVVAGAEPEPVLTPVSSGRSASHACTRRNACRTFC